MLSVGDRLGNKKDKNSKKKKEIEIDVLKHFLNPKARVLKKEEKEEILKKYNISENALPKIFATDPLAKSLKAKIGDVIEFERDDGTGKYLFYRLVV